VQTAAAGHTVGHNCKGKPKEQATVGKTSYQQHTYRKAYESDKPDTQGFQEIF